MNVTFELKCWIYWESCPTDAKLARNLGCHVHTCQCLQYKLYSKCSSIIFKKNCVWLSLKVWNNMRLQRIISIDTWNKSTNNAPERVKNQSRESYIKTLFLAGWQHHDKKVMLVTPEALIVSILSHNNHYFWGRRKIRCSRFYSTQLFAKVSCCTRSVRLGQWNYVNESFCK